MIFLIGYIVGAVLTFCYLTYMREEEYEVAIFTAVFYPLILLISLLILIVIGTCSAIWWIIEGVKRLTRRCKNDRYK